MQSIRDVIKESMTYALEQLDQPALLQDKLYKRFIVKHKLTTKQLNRLVNANAYKLPKKKHEVLSVPTPNKNEYHILLKIANSYGITVTDIVGPRRIREHVDARRIYTVILYIYLNYKLTQVGLKTMRDHSTVINAVTRHDQLIQYEAHYRKIFLTIIDELKEEIPDMFVDEYKDSISQLDKKLTADKWQKLSEYMKNDNNIKKFHAKNS